MKLTEQEEHKILIERLQNMAKDIPGVQVLTGVRCGIRDNHSDGLRPPSLNAHDIHLIPCGYLYRHKGKHSWE